MKNLSRRAFLKLSGAALLAAGLTGTLTASPKILFQADAAPRAVLVEGQPVAFAPGDGFYEISWEGTGRIHIQVLF